MKKLMIASANAHKIEEFKAMLTPLGYEVQSLADLETPIDIEETGTTFEENALIKAQAIHDLLHIPVISDDSGLAVNAMDGAPGVYSARFMGHDTSYDVKNEAIMKAVETAQDRGAQFVCVMAYVDDTHALTFRGEVEGEVAHEIVGKKGFGYDPIFYYPPFQTTLANVSEEQKNSVSHRGCALHQLIAYLKENNL